MQVMNPRPRPQATGGDTETKPLLGKARFGPLFAVTLSSLLLLPMGPASTQQTTTPSVVYEFGRPVRTDEHTYDWYRRTHADAAAARYGIPANVTGDGMDTWHWW